MPARKPSSRYRKYRVKHHERIEAALRDLRDPPGGPRLMTLEEVAEFFGVEVYETVSDWERGYSRPSKDRQEKFKGYLWDRLRLRSDPQRFEKVWQVLEEEWGFDPFTDDKWRALTNQPRPGAGSEGRVRSQPGSVDVVPPTTPDTQPAPSHLTLTPPHLAYLRYWFQEPAWRFVRLANLLGEQDEALAPRSVTLLDVYVPLKVDFSIGGVTKDGAIVDWSAKEERAERPEAQEAKAGPRLPGPVAGAIGDVEAPRLRFWPLLGVLEIGTGGEKGLQDIVDGIQRKIAGRKEKNAIPQNSLLT